MGSSEGPLECPTGCLLYARNDKLEASRGRTWFLALLSILAYKRAVRRYRRKSVKGKYGVCAYCGGRAGTVDHVEPFSYLYNNSDSNCVPACLECNSLATDKLFDSFETKRLY